MNVNDLLEKHIYFFGILLNLIHNLLFCIGPESTILKNNKRIKFSFNCVSIYYGKYKNLANVKISVLPSVICFWKSQIVIIRIFTQYNSLFIDIKMKIKLKNTSN